MLIILSTHPIQYQVPLWQALAKDGRVPFQVWYVTDRHTQVSHDLEFGKTFAWDIQTLEGYDYRLLKSAAGATPSSFWKCRLDEPLVSRLRDIDANAIWIQGWQVAAYWQAAFSARSAGAELWLRGESNDLRQAPLWRRLIKRLLLGWLFRRVDQFLCIGVANRRLYEKFGASPNKLHVAPYAVDNERFALQASSLFPQRESIREQWSIPSDAFCILFCGKFIEKKRPLDLIGAVKLLKQHGQMTNVHLLFVGSGDLGSDLRRGCRVVFDADSGNFQRQSFEDDESPSATFAGFLNQGEISKAYVAADCLVLPSDAGETWGLVVNEAMASGLPCIASSACGCAGDLIVPFWPERVFELGDQGGLADCIARVCREDRSGEMERNRIEKYSIQVTLDEVVRLYELTAEKPNAVVA
jgi:glycosyltransferase involved in cell wall biosynthesis